MSRYHNPAIRQLKDQQVRYAPRDVRLKQIAKAERLISELKPGQSYRYRDLCEKITSYRPEMYPDLVLTGTDAVHDLRCFVEDLSASAQITPESVAEPVLTVDEVSKRYNVSTKTVDRWRSRGLASRRFRFGNRSRVGFLQSAVEKFVTEHSDDVRRGSQFSQLTTEEKEDIIRRARRMARHGFCASQISRRLARRRSRSVETIRYTIRNYDREHPEAAVFPDTPSLLNEDQKLELYRNFRRGVPAQRLARRFGRSVQSIYRIVGEARARQIRDQDISFIDSTEFTRRDADELILADAPASPTKESQLKPPPGLPPYLASLYTVPLLNREQEAHHFRKMNYLKYKAARLRDTLNVSRPKNSEMDQIEKWLDESMEVKNFLIRSNLRLVVSIAKRHLKSNMNFFEMVSDGNMSLIRAIEKFDYSKGNKFSTYATWAIMKNFARSIPAEHTRLDRFRTGNDELFYHSTDNRGNQFQEELVNQKQHAAIMDILGQLDSREREIIICRYGLSEGSEPLTLEQVGQRFGVTKERIRQLESRALDKARKIAQQQAVDIPGI